MTAPRAAEQSFYFKVMYWSEIGAAKPLACTVVVTEDDLKEEKSNDVVYEKAVQNALYEALGKSKGKNMNELQKVLALHDWLVVNCQYDLSYGAKHKNPYDKYGAIVDGYAVCDGYTKAYNDLLSRVGVAAERVEGFKKKERHAWSCVTIDEKKYYVDVTSDDPTPDTPGTVNAFTLSRYKKEMQGVYSTSVSRDTLDECPMAYKDSNTIMEQIRPTVEVIEKLTPVYNFKAGAR